MELEDNLKRAEVIDVSKVKGKTIRFGATVRLANEESEEKSTYQIVGAFEAEISEGRISISSPLGRALIGRETGDSVEVDSPRGTRYYEIMRVQYK